MNAHWKRMQQSGGTALILGALLSVSGALAFAAGGTIEDPSEADRILLERAKVAKQIVVDGQPGTLQADQEKQALQRAQEGWENMDSARAASAQRRASWEAAKQEAARLQEQRQAKYWESTLNMERLLARQQEIEAQRQHNLEIDQQRTLKDWTVVGAATDAGLQEQQRREEVRKENLRRYQDSLQSGWGATRPQDGQTAQQALEADRLKREQELLQYNLGYWNQIINNTEAGREQQDELEKARRDLQTGLLRERLKEWDSIGSAEESGLRDQSAREQARRANAERYQQQLREEYNTARLAGQGVTPPSAAPAAPSATPAH